MKIRPINAVTKFFNAEKSVYSHRNRSIEIIALEKCIDINDIKNEIKTILNNEGRVEAIMTIRKRFHVPLATAWIFVDKLDV